MCVHDAGDGAIVDVTVALFDIFDRGNGFFFGFVGEHGAECAIADNTDVGEFGAVLLVDYEAAFVVDFEANVFEAKAGGVWAAADGDEDDVCIELRKSWLGTGRWGCGGDLRSLSFHLWRLRLRA